MPAVDRDTQRLACLQAMGLTLYSSRRDLPGAAPSRRVLAAGVPAPEPPPAGLAPVAPGADTRARDAEPPTRCAARQPEAAGSEAAAVPRPPESSVRFRLAAVLAGGALWLEELGDAPLAREQVALVQAMARACGWATAAPRVQEFAWPMHRNPQLDCSAEAAGAALQAFLARLLSEAGLERVLLLGAGARERVAALTLPVPVLALPATREMLAGAAPKREAWAVLRGVAGS